MKRFLVFISILCFFSAFAEERAVMNQAEPTSSIGFIATGDAIKKLETKSIELSSKIKVEETRAVEGLELRDSLQILMVEIDIFLQEWNTLNLQRTQIVNGSNDSVFGNEKILTDIIQREQTIALKVVAMSRMLGVSSPASDISFDQLLRFIDGLRVTYVQKIGELDAVIDAAQTKKATFLSDASEQLGEVTVEIDRLKHVKNNQILQSSKKSLYYLSIFLFLYLAKILSKKVLGRIEKDFSKSHQQALQLVHRWIFVILFVIIFLALFLSEFVSLLPFIAIIGTGIGLGLRDVIYSFIAWFAVGSDAGYQEGDILEIDGVNGRVYTISPILTTLEEYGPQGVTGKLVSIPNKTIFEKNIKNLSRTAGYTMLQFEFLLTNDSDVARARELLMEIIGHRDLGPYYHARSEITKIKNMYGYDEKDLHPQINVSHDPHGIILRAKFLVDVHKKYEEQYRISEEFMIKIQKEKKLHLKEL